MNSHMTPEQRRVMERLNDQAKRHLAELLQETPPMSEHHPTTDPVEERHAIPQVTNSIRYNQESLAQTFRRIFDGEIMALRDAGQKEYAHDNSSPFANFERAAADLGVDRKQVLWIFAMKHKDGIAGFLRGHTSQREDVRGRINDLIVYLLLLRGMINEETGQEGLFGLGELDEAGD